MLHYPIMFLNFQLFFTEYNSEHMRLLTIITFIFDYTICIHCAQEIYYAHVWPVFALRSPKSASAHVVLRAAFWIVKNRRQNNLCTVFACAYSNKLAGIRIIGRKSHASKMNLY